MDNYEQLVKALRCCISNNPPETCVGCTYSKCNNECAVRRMILDAAAAIEELSKTVKDLTTKVECSPMQISGKAFDRAIEAWNDRARKAVQE